MELGTFSVSLSVKDIKASKEFYETLGFVTHPECGSIEDKWLILSQGTTVIGLFQDMFDHNILTFNPEDARAIEKRLQESGINIDTPTSGSEGPTHFIMKDPDGNVIMFDQHQ